MIHRFFSHRKNLRRVCGWGLVGAGVFLTLAIISRSQKPRAWQIDEMPVAFWVWQNRLPNHGDVQAVIDSLNTRVLFVRAGQIDFEKNRLHRIREAQGTLPQRVDLHLVYNATRSTLSQFEQIKIKKLAALLANTFQTDCQRALNEGARVVGLQLDFDIPTSGLGRYAKLLRRLRKCLKSNAQVSITGLPTWMESGELPKALAEVSFWIPQCYGAMIPQRLDILAPIASSQSITTWIEKAQQLQRPYYAGLSAYGYAIHYSTAGQLLEVRGDVDPALIANHSRFELVERRPFDTKAKASRWRYVYRARGDLVLDGLAVRPGEFVLLDMPGIESLQASAEAAREYGGDQLLGICLFRLPCENDQSNLSFLETVCALKSEPPVPKIEIEITGKGEPGKKRFHLTLTITNSGSVSSLLGDDALTVDVRLPPGSLRSVTTDRSLSAEPYFDLQPCAERRANRLKIKTASLPVRTRLQADLEMEGEFPESLQVLGSMRTSDHRDWLHKQTVPIKR